MYSSFPRRCFVKHRVIDGLAVTVNCGCLGWLFGYPVECHDDAGEEVGIERHRVQVSSVLSVTRIAGWTEGLE